MTLDIRIPIGLMFTVVGLILIAFGAITFGDAKIYETSNKVLESGVNINILWGAVCFAFGAFMLLWSKFSKDEPKQE